jgi:hypothetical protein
MAARILSRMFLLRSILGSEVFLTVGSERDRFPVQVPGFKKPGMLRRNSMDADRSVCATQYLKLQRDTNLELSPHCHKLRTPSAAW